MAKCIRELRTGKVDRVSNEKAVKRVSTGKWEYMGKSEYKRIKGGK